ncbi:porin-like protein [Roseinatronobacter monicus]|uniref:Porin-like protein n=2 Tax=Roseinatronobacter monicus TaxID=393481 RepID=A0A543KGS1_9RHOB|nr:porin-like protein [Roseinatronobacter monicus]
MKKILLATTALVASAGVAAADVTLSGDGRMGITYDSAADSNSRLAFTNRARVTFSLSGETDSGMAFGGSFRADNASGAAAGTAGHVFISGEFGRLRMGDVDSAFQALFGNIGGVGLTGLGDLNELDHSTSGGAFSLGSALTASQLGLVNGWAFGATNGVSSVDDFSVFVTPSLASSLFTYTPPSAATNPDTYIGSIADIVDAFDNVFNQAGGGVSGFVFDNDFDATTFLTSLENNGAQMLDSDGNITNVANGDAASIRVPGFAAGVFAQSVTNEAVFAGFGFDSTDPAPGGGQDQIAALFGVDDFGDMFFGGIDWEASASLNTPAIDSRVLFDYSIEGFSFALGYSQTGPHQAGSIAAAYTFDGLTVSAGYGQARWRDAYTASFTASAPIQPGISASLGNSATATLATVTEDAKARDWNVGVKYDIDALSMAAVYQDKRFSVGGTQIDKHRTMGASVGYTMDAIGVSAFATQTKSDLAPQDARAYGLGASYNLGGGAHIRGGVVNSRGFTGSSSTTGDLGLAFTF